MLYVSNVPAAGAKTSLEDRVVIAKRIILSLLMYKTNSITLKLLQFGLYSLFCISFVVCSFSLLRPHDVKCFPIFGLESANYTFLN